MRGDTLIQRHPPTPPTLMGDFQSGLHRVAQYNADRGYPYDDPSYAGMVGHEGIPSRTSHMASHTGESVGLGIQYDSYGASDYYHDNQAHRQHSQGAFSPPTPRSTIDDDYATRSTHSVHSRGTASPHRRYERHDSPQPKPTPKVRKSKAAKGDKAKTPKLTAPLSILTDKLHHIPVKDMKSWVNRTADVRRKEAEKRNGYITRPMNSFMLYRSAYAERAKAWCLQNNHQVVSSVAGESWPLEPPEVRDRFNEYAKIERINHQNAHPTYKFSPSKAAAPPRKRKDEWSDEEPSDLEDTDWGHDNGRRSRQAKRFQRSVSYPPPLGPEYTDRGFGPGANGMMRSSWEMTNEGRPMPMPMHPDMYHQQYYHTASYPPAQMPAHYGEDLRMRRVAVPPAPPAPPAPTLQFSSNQLLGLPGGDASDLMQQLHPQATTPYDDGQVDPLLLAYDGGHRSEVDATAIQHDYRNGYSNMIDEKYDQQEIDRLLEIGHAHDSYNHSWQSDPTMSSLDQESEFDKWVGEH